MRKASNDFGRAARLLLFGAALSPCSPCLAVDAIDTNMTILVSLDMVERALFCGESEAFGKRTAILRTIVGVENGCYGMDETHEPWLGDWVTVGIRGGKTCAEFAYARLLKQAGILFGRPDYAARGRSYEERLIAENGVAPDFRDERRVPEKVRAYYRLMEENRRDLEQEIRPGEKNGGNFWNVRSKLFIYPPSFDFRRIAGAASYRFQVLDDVHCSHEFVTDRPTASLLPVWRELPVGFTTVSCRALDETGNDLGLAGERVFWRSAPFDPAECAPAKRGYAEANRLLLDFLCRWPEVARLEAGAKPDIARGSNFESYPSKMQSALIRAMIVLSHERPDCRERALRLARISADYLLSTCEGPGSPLEGFTATYAGSGQMAGRYSGMHMLVYPADSGMAFLSLYRETKDQKYLEAAIRIGGTYLRLQGEDGTWFLKVYAKDASPVVPNRLIPTSVVPFLEELYREIGDKRFRMGADRAFAWIERGPLRDWDWSGQFEDSKPADFRYANLTKHMACDTALYLLERYPGDRRRLAQARDIIRFSEDQFVVWRAPCRPDGKGPWSPVYPFFAWRTPAALEQYSCYLPIDASAAKLVKTYLALYRAEGRDLDLAKALALGDAIVNNQDDNGRIRTYWIPETEDSDDLLAGTVGMPSGGDWFNCAVADAAALELLSAVR